MPESQNGRIGGGVLKDNLLRQGVDLAFDTDLLYLKVDPNVDAPTVPGTEFDDGDPNYQAANKGTANKGIGINTQAPNEDLSIPSLTNPFRTVGLKSTDYTNIANFTIDNSQIVALGGDGFINFNAANNIFATAIATDDLKIDFNTISTTTPNTNIEIRPNGNGTVNINSNWNITGDLRATGNIQTIGDFTFGSDTEDDVVFAANINSDVIPDQTNTYNIGSENKRWLDIYTSLLTSETIIADTFIVGDGQSSLGRRQGNTFYVSTNGDDTNVGDHQHGAFRTLKHALSVVDGSTAGPTAIHIYPGEYEEEFPLTVPSHVDIIGEDLRNVIIKPTVATRFNDAFLVEDDVTIENLTIKDFFYDNGSNTGYAFKFTSNGLISTRSPYIKNVTVITKGSVTSADDPRGFDQGNAGKGAYIDGSVLDSASLEASMLFHSCTFITPGVDAITMTNGVRVEWLNSFTYFANRGLYATQGATGKLMPDASIRYGAEVRSIGSACVYGNFGVVADGANTLLYLISHNFAYIGSGKDVSNDNTLHIQSQETVELNSGTIVYTSTDQKGNFRVGDNFFVDFDTGETSIDANSIDFSGIGSIIVNNGVNSTYIDGERVDTGNIRITGNTVTTVDGDLNLSPQTELFNTDNNAALIVSRGTDIQRNNETADFRYNTETDLFEGFSSGNLSFGGVYSSDRAESVDAHDTNNTIVLRAADTVVGTIDSDSTNLHGLSTGDVLFDNNLVTTTLSNSILELKRETASNVVKIYDIDLKENNFNNTTNNPLVLTTTGLGFVKFSGTTGLRIPTGTEVQQPPAFSVVNYSASGPVTVTIDVSPFAAITGSYISDGIAIFDGEGVDVTNATYDGIAETVTLTLNSAFNTSPIASDLITIRGLTWDDSYSTNLFLPEIGETRYNTDQAYLETWNGDSWQRSAGEGEEVTDAVLKEFVDIYTLVLG